MKDKAIEYLKQLSSDDIKYLKKMLNRNIVCGIGYAKLQGLDVTMFNSELKRILNGQ
jgi:hypothetical protein